MALTIHKVGPEIKTVIMTQKLWQTADKDRLVVDGDPAAAFLFCIPGREIPIADALRYGLARAEEPVIAPEVKESQPAETKELRPGKKEWQVCPVCKTRYKQAHVCRGNDPANDESPSDPAVPADPLPHDEKVAE